MAGRYIDVPYMKRVFYGGALLSVSTFLLVMNNFADQYLVTLGEVAGVHAYTLNVPIYWILISIGTVMGVTYASPVRRHLLAGDVRKADEAAVRAIVYAVVFGLVDAVIVGLCATPLFELIRYPEVRRAAFDYLLPLLLFFFAITSAIVMASLLNAEGRTDLYLATLFVMLVANIVSDLVYVDVLGMGVFGNGLGTATGGIVASLFAAACLRSGRTQVTVSLRNFSWSFDDIQETLRLIRTPLARMLSKYIAEVFIRFTLYMTYALSYGIPMLYSSVISVIGVGVGTFLSVEYRRLYAEKRFVTARRLFIGSTLIGFAVMMAMSVLFNIFADPLASVFTSQHSLSESHSTLVWTLTVLCFTAPFVGLKNMFGAVLAPFGRFRQAFPILVAWEITRMALVAWAISVDFRIAIYCILGERILAAVAGFIAALWRMRHDYVPERSLDLVVAG